MRRTCLWILALAMSACATGCWHARPTAEWFESVHAVDPAPEAPELVVMARDDEGSRGRLTPGRTGRVTLMCFAPMSFPIPQPVAQSLGTMDQESIDRMIEVHSLRGSGPAAIKFCSDLGDRYGSIGLDVISVVERTVGTERLAPAFLRYFEIAGKTYYDDGRALDEMFDAIDAAVAAKPAIFVLDRQRRVRCFRVGFSFSEARKLNRYGRATRIDLLENVPDGEEGVEDWVKRLLGE